MSIKLTSRSFATKLSEIGIRKHEITKANTGTAKCFSVRPRGYAYPVGLNSLRVFGNVAANSTVTGGATTITQGAADSPTQNTTHVFTSSGQFNPGFTGTVEYFLVAGGGGGGFQIAGGGGGGGIIYTNDYPVIHGANVYITIGAGGASATRGANTLIEANTVASVLCHGGGQGGNGTGDGIPGVPGGCGGGSSRKRSAPTSGSGGLAVNPMPGPSYSIAYGSAGGRGSDTGNPDNNGQGGGGGGVGGTGGNASPTVGGVGGAGLDFVQSPDMTTPLHYCAGGGGGAWDGTGGGAGNPIAGAGSPGQPPAGAAAGNGTANRGGGAGGGGYGGNQPGGTGGSGFATIRYFSINETLFEYIL